MGEGIELTSPGGMEGSEDLVHSRPWTLQVKSLRLIFSKKKDTLLPSQDKFEDFKKPMCGNYIATFKMLFGRELWLPW